MERYKLILAYDGTKFVGSQRQPNKRTVQGELENALRAIGWIGESVLLAGRTDTGVHASGQVAAFDIDWGNSANELLRALNANMPKDLAVNEIQKASPDFHPRFDAKARKYIYRLFCQPVRNPLREHYFWRVYPKVDGKLLKQVASELVGTFDFSAFGSATSEKGTTIRTVSLAEWNCQNDEWTFEIEADAFLYRMVRRLVFVQIAVGQGRLKVESIKKALTANEKLPSGLAPANGLTLTAVFYSK